MSIVAARRRPAPRLQHSSTSILASLGFYHLVSMWVEAIGARARWVCRHGSRKEFKSNVARQRRDARNTPPHAFPHCSTAAKPQNCTLFTPWTQWPAPFTPVRQQYGSCRLRVPPSSAVGRYFPLHYSCQSTMCTPNVLKCRRLTCGASISGPQPATWPRQGGFRARCGWTMRLAQCRVRSSSGRTRTAGAG